MELVVGKRMVLARTRERKVWGVWGLGGKEVWELGGKEVWELCLLPHRTETMVYL